MLERSCTTSLKEGNHVITGNGFRLKNVSFNVVAVCSKSLLRECRLTVNLPDPGFEIESQMKTVSFA